jgi:phosphatidylinositol alpha-1,6-mannosyltransferase
LTPDFPPAKGGIQRLVHGLARHWQGIDARILTIDTAGAREFDRGQPIDVRRVALPQAFGYKGSVALLNAAAVVEAMRFRPQAVLSAHIVTSPATWVIGAILRVPVIQYLHMREINARPRLARFALRHANAVVAVSRRTEALAIALGAEAGRVHRIPPGVDLPDAPGLPRSARPVIVTVARLRDAYKGHDVVLQALRLVRVHVPDVLWAVIGDGRLRRLYERTAEDLGLNDHVRFLGTVDDVETDAWLDRAHVFVMPSRTTPDGQGEGFPLAYLEAAAHGLPIVAGIDDGAVDAVVDGETGLLVDPTDPKAVAGALIELLLDEGRAERLGRAALERTRKFGWVRVAAQVEELLIQTAGR